MLPDYKRGFLMNIYFFAPFFTLMIRSIFPIEFPRIFHYAAMWISAVFILLVAFSPVSLFSFTLPPFFVFFLLLSLLYLYVVSMAWIRGRSHTPAFTLGLLILFAGTFNDLLNEIDVIDTVYVVHYTMFIYLLIYAYIFADKSNRLQMKAQKLADALEIQTEDLRTWSAEGVTAKSE